MLRECSLRVAALGALGVLILGPVAAGAQSAARPTRKPTTTAAKKESLDPKAVEVLKAVGSRLAAARTVSVVAVETVESLGSPAAPPVSVNRSEVTLQRPDKMRVIVSGEGTRRSEVYCNGKTMLTYSPDEKALVIAKAPPTINDCLKDAYRASAIDSPFVDLIVADPDSNVIPALRRATYVGQSQIAEQTTDVVTYSGGNVFMKMWVGTEDKLPRRLQAVYLDDPNRLRRSVLLSDWKFDVPLRPEVFTQLKTDSRDHVESTEPRPVGTSGVQRAQRDRPLTIHTYSAKYWGSTVGGVGSVYSNDSGGYYQSPDGYTYHAPGNYGAYPPPAVGYNGAPCYDCGPDYWPTEGAAEDTAASFNLSLSTAGWYNVPAPGFSQTIPNVTTLPPFEVGQIMTTLPVGCAAYTRGAAFYLCGSQWFAGVYGPNGELYFRVISPPYSY